MYVREVESMNSTFLSAQNSTNICKKIDMGMRYDEKNNAHFNVALNFMENYNLFINQLDDLTDSTVKFWDSIKGDTPCLERVLSLGKTNYEQRFKIIHTISRISKITDKNLDFLLKYALFMKVIVQDSATASNIFQRLLWISDTERAGVLYEAHKLVNFNCEEEVMIVIVSLEQSSLMTILDINIEIENRLGYKKNELVKYSATKLMPKIIGDLHHIFIKKFFQSMKSNSLSIEKSHLIKHKNETAILCNTLKKIIPGLNEGFRGLILMKEDRTMRSLISHNTDHVISKTGCFMCNSKWNIQEVTPEVYGLFGISADGGQTFKDSFNILNFFPELSCPEVIKVVSKPRGGVIKAMMKNFSMDNEGEPVQNEKAILLWMKLIEQWYGNEITYLLLYSPICLQWVNRYYPMPEFGNVLYSRESKFIEISQKENLGKMENSEGSANKTHFIDLSESQSMASSANNSRTGSTSQQKADWAKEISQELQERNVSRSTPLMIKKFSIFLFLFLLLTFSLIAVETERFYNCSINLIDTLRLIKYFQIRYELLGYVTDGSRVYQLYREASSKENFEAYCDRGKARVARFREFDYLTKKEFEKIGINYDAKIVPIFDGTTTYYSSLNYLLTLYLSHEATVFHIDDYKTAHACLTDFESPVCKENSISFNFTIDNNETVRNEQHPVSETLFKDLKEIARNGKISMYTIIAICIGIVMASSVFLFVMLIVVIKGKSKVLSVFADIEEEDINRIIGDTNSVSISTKNFNSNLLNKCGNNEEKFWKLLILKKKKQRDKRNNAPVEEKKEEQKIKHQEEEGVSQKSKEKSQFARENEAEINYLSPINLEKEKERARERRAESRRRILSQIDSSLRNSSICKMLIILIVFLIYGSSSLYINYIIFDFNEVTTTLK